MVKSSKISGNVGIGHTRWATHGVVNNENTHPHLSYSKSVSLVHNGIVENYDDLKKFLFRNNVSIQSQTDSEIIAHLIDLKLNCKPIKFQEFDNQNSFELYFKNRNTNVS